MNRYRKVWIPVFAQIDLKYATLKIKDGTTPTPNELEITIGEGNLTYTEAKNMEYTLDRGILDEVREGDQIPIDVSLDFVWEYLRGSSASGAPPTVEEALKNVGNAAAWVSTDSDACRPYAVDLEINYAPVPASCGDREIITLPDFRYESLDHDLRAGTVSVSGKCNVTDATVVRSSQSS
jgi:hypothetical protein